MLGFDEGPSNGMELGSDEGARLGWLDGLLDGIELGREEGQLLGCDVNLLPVG